MNFTFKIPPNEFFMLQVTKFMVHIFYIVQISMPFSELIFSMQVILDNNEILEPCFFPVYLCQSIILI